MTPHQCVIKCATCLQQCFVCLFVWVEALRPSQQYFGHVGTNHSFLGITSTFWEVNVSCSRIQQCDFLNTHFRVVIHGQDSSSVRNLNLHKKNLVKPTQN